MKVQALLAAALLSLTAAGADAACQRPTGVAPVVPDGAKADEQTMHDAHDAIQAYVVALEGYKTCLKDQADNAAADVPVEVKLAWIAQGDAALDAANYAANQFSFALKAYKARTTPPSAPAAK